VIIIDFLLKRMEGEEDWRFWGLVYFGFYFEYTKNNNR
jgi:hypothetical protein